jgi:hypothetical protein
MGVREAERYCCSALFLCFVAVKIELARREVGYMVNYRTFWLHVNSMLLRQHH